MKTLTFRGERNVWIDFVSKVKKQNKTIWECLKPILIEYNGKNKL